MLAKQCFEHPGLYFKAWNKNSQIQDILNKLIIHYYKYNSGYSPDWNQSFILTEE